MKNSRPTPRQIQWLDTIKLLQKAKKYNPSHEELGKAMAVSVPAVSKMLSRMEALGLIRRKPNARRQIEVLV